MKKYTKFFTLMLTVCMVMAMMSMSAFAGVIGTVSNEEGYAESVTITAPDGGSVADKDQIKVTYDGGTANAMYLLLILEEGKSIPDKDNILYVNQETADANGVVTFGGGEYAVYPKDIVDSTIWLAGGDFVELTAVADITPKAPSFTVLLGDVDLSGEVKAADLTMLARHIGNISTITDPKALANADTTKDGSVTAGDLTMLARYIGNIINSFD